MDWLILAVGAVVALAASAALVTALERLGARFGMPEATLGLMVALAADSPEVSSAVSAYVRGDASLGAGVVLGSNAFNLAALLGLGAVVAGRIALHRRVVLFEGAVALAIAGLAVATIAGLAEPLVCTALMIVVLIPYVILSALPPSGDLGYRCPRPGEHGWPGRSRRRNSNSSRPSCRREGRGVTAWWPR